MCGKDTDRPILFFKTVYLPSERPMRVKLPGCKQDMTNQLANYALANAALQAFSAPTTVKRINGLMEYMI